MASLLSFRDPGGFCFVHQSRFFRVVEPQTAIEIASFLDSNLARGLAERGSLVSTRKLNRAEQQELLESRNVRHLVEGCNIGAIFEHEKVAFPSYPYEWAPSMLYAAGELTLDLAQNCLKEGYGLKDASPYNVLFQRGAPLFIDVLSYEVRNPCDPIWKPYAQFCRNFILPLLAHKAWGVRLSDIFCSRRDGLQPSELYRLCSPLQKLLRPFLTLVSLPTWLSGREAGDNVYRDRMVKNPEKARFILDSSFYRLRRMLRKVRPEVKKSFWAHYPESHSYSEDAFRSKEDCLHSFLREKKPARVLDVGANTGHFSSISAKAEAEVVSIDSDASCIDEMYRRAQSEKMNILPLVVDFSRPSPAQGWRNREHERFLDRAKGSFDAVLMFGILHHLLVTERIPLREIVDAAAELTECWLLIEFISPQDKMFQLIARGRDKLHAGLTEAIFEAECARAFDLVEVRQLPGMSRRLYLFRKKL